MSRPIPTTRTRTVATIALALALGLSACSSDDPGDGIASEASSTTAGAAVTASTAPDDTTGSDDTTTTTEAELTTTTAESTTTTTADDDGTTTTTGLAGEPWDGFASDGDVLSVFGVPDDDVLNLRAGPGTDTEILVELDPTADDLVATGQARQLSRSFWYEVTAGGRTGWVSVGFVAFEGPTDDATAEYLADNPRPAAETMVELGQIVAAGFASEDPPSEIVQSVAPTVGDLGEITVDVVGLGDDAGAGYRLHIFANPTESGEGFELRTIERTSMCTRGVSGDFCV